MVLTHAHIPPSKRLHFDFDSYNLKTFSMCFQEVWSDRFQNVYATPLNHSVCLQDVSTRKKKIEDVWQSSSNWHSNWYLVNAGNVIEKIVYIIWLKDALQTFLNGILFETSCKLPWAQNLQGVLTFLGRLQHVIKPIK